jgi:hypothetical protein
MITKYTKEKNQKDTGEGKNEIKFPEVPDKTELVLEEQINSGKSDTYIEIKQILLMPSNCKRGKEVLQHRYREKLICMQDGIYIPEGLLQRRGSEKNHTE